MDRPPDARASICYFESWRTRAAGWRLRTPAHGVRRAARIPSQDTIAAIGRPSRVAGKHSRGPASSGVPICSASGPGTIERRRPELLPCPPRECMIRRPTTRHWMTPPRARLARSLAGCAGTHAASGQQKAARCRRGACGLSCVELCAASGPGHRPRPPRAASAKAAA